MFSAMLPEARDKDVNAKGHHGRSAGRYRKGDSGKPGVHARDGNA